MPENLAAVPHDGRIKAMFRHPVFVRAFIQTTLEPRFRFEAHQLHTLGSEWITSHARRRIGDCVWLLRDQTGQPQLALLIEFQASYDRDMTQRMAEYIHLLQQDLDRQALCKADGSPLDLVPLVFHVGPKPWPRPWYVYDRSDAMRGALGYRKGTTVDIHAYADADLPQSNLALCLIALELNRLRGPGHEKEVGAEIVRIMETVESLLAEGPEDLARDFAAFIATGFTSVVADFALRPRTFGSLEALKTAMISFVEIKERRFRQGLAEGEARGEARGRTQGEARGRAQGEARGRARALADFVGAAWSEETQRAFETRLASLATGAWPTIPDLYAARQAARDPLELLEVANDQIHPAANGRAPEDR